MRICCLKEDCILAQVKKKMKSHVEATCKGDDLNDKMKLISLYLKSLTGERWNSDKFRQTFHVIYDKTWEEYKNEK